MNYSFHKIRTMDKCKHQVYSRFTATKQDGSTVKLRIQDMPADMLDTALDLYMKYFITEEPINKAIGVYKSEYAKAEVRELIKEAIPAVQSHAVICCVDDDSNKIGELAGVSIMYLTDKGTNLDNIQCESPEMQKLLEIVEITLNEYIKKEPNVDKYYNDLFIVVHPEFRKMGIAQEFLKTRLEVCQLENVALVMSWMSAWGTQKAGERDGWETVSELPYDVIGKRHGVVFKDAPPTNKLMLYRIAQ